MKSRDLPIALLGDGVVFLGDGSEIIETPQRGPRNPPPLGCHIIYVPEAARKWWAHWADGTVAAMCSSSAEAQQAISRGYVKGASNG